MAQLAKNNGAVSKACAILSTLCSSVKSTALSGKHKEQLSMYLPEYLHIAFDNHKGMSESEKWWRASAWNAAQSGAYIH